MIGALTLGILASQTDFIYAKQSMQPNSSEKEMQIQPNNPQNHNHNSNHGSDKVNSQLIYLGNQTTQSPVPPQKTFQQKDKTKQQSTNLSNVDDILKQKLDQDQKKIEGGAGSSQKMVAESQKDEDAGHESFDNDMFADSLLDEPQAKDTIKSKGPAKEAEVSQIDQSFNQQKDTKVTNALATLVQPNNNTLKQLESPQKAPDNNKNQVLSARQILDQMTKEEPVQQVKQQVQAQPQPPTTPILDDSFMKNMQFNFNFGQQAVAQMTREMELAPEQVLVPNQGNGLLGVGQVASLDEGTDASLAHQTPVQSSAIIPDKPVDSFASIQNLGQITIPVPDLPYQGFSDSTGLNAVSLDTDGKSKQYSQPNKQTDQLQSQTLSPAPSPTTSSSPQSLNIVSSNIMPNIKTQNAAQPSQNKQNQVIQSSSQLSQQAIAQNNRIQQQAQKLVEMNQQAQINLEAQVRQIAIARADMRDKQEKLQKLKEETARKEREAKLQQEILRKKKAEEALQRERALAEQRIQEEKRRKAEKIAQTKAKLAQKLQEAQEKKRKQILAEQTKQKAKELARQKAIEVAEEKAKQFAQEILKLQQQEEQVKQQEAQKKLEMQKKEIERQKELRRMAELRKKAEEEAQRKKIEEEAEKELQKKIEDDKMDEMREQVEKEAMEKKQKEDKEAENFNELGDLVNNLQSLSQKAKENQDQIGDNENIQLEEMEHDQVKLTVNESESAVIAQKSNQTQQAGTAQLLLANQTSGTAQPRTYLSFSDFMDDNPPENDLMLQQQQQINSEKSHKKHKKIKTHKKHDEEIIEQDDDDQQVDEEQEEEEEENQDDEYQINHKSKVKAEQDEQKSLNQQDDESEQDLDDAEKTADSNEDQNDVSDQDVPPQEFHKSKKHSHLHHKHDSHKKQRKAPKKKNKMPKEHKKNNKRKNNQQIVTQEKQDEESQVEEDVQKQTHRVHQNDVIQKMHKHEIDKQSITKHAHHKLHQKVQSHEKRKHVSQQPIPIRKRSHFRTLNFDDIGIVDPAKVGLSAVSQLQKELENRVKKNIGQLEILQKSQNQDGQAHYVYDYQLVRLSEKQQQKEQEALQYADQIMQKLSQVRKDQDEMNEKFDVAQQQLNQYRDRFYKQKRSLQQDRDSFVKIKEQAVKEVKDQMEIQSSLEIASNEDLQQKADLQMSQTQQENQGKYSVQTIDIQFEGPNRTQEAQKDTKSSNLTEEASKAQIFVNQSTSIKSQTNNLNDQLQGQSINNSIDFTIKLHQAQVNQREEHEKRIKLEEDIKKQYEVEYIQKIKPQLKQNIEKAEKQLKELQEHEQIAEKNRKQAVEDAKSRAKTKASEFEQNKLKIKKQQENEDKIEEEELQKAEGVEKQAVLAETNSKKDLQKKKETAEKAQVLLEVKKRQVIAAQKSREEEIMKEKVAKEMKQQAQQKQRAQKEAQIQAIQAKRKQEMARIEAEFKKKQEELELQQALAEAKQAEESQKKAEQEAKQQLEKLQKQQEQKKKEVKDGQIDDKKKIEMVNKDTKNNQDLKNSTEKADKLPQNAPKKQFVALAQVVKHKLDMKKQRKGHRKTINFDLKIIQQYEQDAIAKINQATLIGLQNGEYASRKLHADAKNQSEEMTADAIGKLKDKFDSTKAQVLAIVNNFGKIRSDLQELKNEYLQEQSHISANDDYVQLDEEALLEADHRVMELEKRVTQKKQEMNSAYDGFDNLMVQLTEIKSQLVDYGSSQNDMDALNRQNEKDDLKLVQLFERQSAHMRAAIKQARLRKRRSQSNQ